MKPIHSSSRYLARMRLRMMIENAVGIALCAVVTALSTVLFAQLDNRSKYSSSDNLTPLMSTLAMLMGLSFGMLMIWILLLLYLCYRVDAYSTKLRPFAIITCLSVSLGISFVVRAFVVFLKQGGAAECRATLFDGPKSCDMLIPTAAMALIAFVVYPIAIYIGRAITLHRAFAPMPFHNASLQDLANRAEAATLDAEAAALKAAMVSGASTSTISV